MAWTAVGSYGTDQNKTAGTGMSLFQPGSSIAAGSVIVVTIACDNVQTTDGNSSTVTSVVGNYSGTFTKALEYTNGEAAAAAGATVSLWYAYIPTLISAFNDQIDVSINAAVAAKACGAYIFSNTGGACVVAASAGSASDVDPASMTISGLTSREYLFVRADATERGNYGYGNSTNYTVFMQNTTTDPGNATDIAIGAEYRIFTGTGDTTDPTTGTPQSASVYVAFSASALPLTVNVTGVSSTASVGTVTQGTTVRPSTTGVASTSAVGSTSISGSASTTATHVLSTVSVGSVSISVNNSFSATGLSSTTAVGTVNAAWVNSGEVSGVSASGVVGSVTAHGAASVVASGVYSTAYVGSIITGLPNVAELIGLSITSSLGNVSSSARASVAVSGISSAASVGIVQEISGKVATPLPTPAITTSVGVTTPNQTNTRVSVGDVHVSGMAALLGVTGIRAWGLVDDTAPSAWTTIQTE